MGGETLLWHVPRRHDGPTRGLQLQIDEASVVAAGGEPRTFEIEKDEESIVLWRYTDDGSTELMRVLSHDEIVGQFDHEDGSTYSVAFSRVAD